MNNLYTIDPGGDCFIKEQIDKRIKFYIRFCFILIGLSAVIFVIKISPITTSSVIFFILITAHLLFFHLRGFARSIKIQQHIIQAIEISATQIFLTGYGSFRRDPMVHGLDRQKIQISKSERSIFGEENVVAVRSEDLPKKEFYIFTDHWDNWTEIQRKIVHGI